MVPTELELAARRVKWLQSMVKHPEGSSHVVAVLFGKMKSETEPTIEPDGSLSEKANVMAKKFAEDLNLFRELGAADEFFEEWDQQHGASWLHLLQGQELGEQFGNVDGKELRANFRGRSGQGTLRSSR